MSEPKGPEHTPGPIHTGELGYSDIALWDENENNLVGTAQEEDVGAEVCEANAARLALCWNEHDDLTAKAVLLDEAAGVLRKFMEINERHGYEFDSNEPGWFAVARAVLARVPKGF